MPILSIPQETFRFGFPPFRGVSSSYRGRVVDEDGDVIDILVGIVKLTKIQLTDPKVLCSSPL